MPCMHRAPDVRRPLWERIAALVSARRSWVLALILLALGGAVMGLISDNGAAEQSPVVIPSNAESARVTELLKHFYLFSL